MAMTVWGIVSEGRIVPSSPLPEGARVEIRLAEPAPDIPEELREEFEAWDRASVRALELTERLAIGVEEAEDDDLINDLIAHNPAFRKLLEESLASPLEPFPFAGP